MSERKIAINQVKLENEVNGMQNEKKLRAYLTRDCVRFAYKISSPKDYNLDKVNY